MLTKIIVKNVGTLKAFDTPQSPKLDRITAIYARNGRGKSTLTSILRAAKEQDATAILARRTFAKDAGVPDITLVRSSGTIKFNGQKWSSPAAPIEVFDTTFIADNIYAGEAPDLPTDRGLFTVILGHEGVRLARKLEWFVQAAKRTGTGLKTATDALRNDLPSDLTLEKFITFSPPTDLDRQLQNADNALQAAEKRDQVATLPRFTELGLPATPANLPEILGSTVADIDTASRQQLLSHFEHFKLGRKGAEWVQFGMEHIHADRCPMCGRDGMNELELVTAYGQIFSSTYKAHLKTITDAIQDLDERLGKGAVDHLTKTVSENQATLQKWSKYLKLDDTGWTAGSEVGSAISSIHTEMKAVLERKRQDPLEKLGIADLATATAALSEAATTIATYNRAAQVANAAIDAALIATTQTVADVKLKRENIAKRARWNDPGVQQRLQSYLKAKRQDDRTKSVRTQVQTRVKATSSSAGDHYHTRVNHHLQRFGAKFSVADFTSNMAGNAGASDYGLIIRGVPVPRGRGRMNSAEPSFANTLSAGDKTTLAFAFFLASLERDGKLSDKIVVFDDPLSSHDSYRKAKTIEAIRELSTKCKQTIVLSHDQYFLRDLYEDCKSLPFASYQIEFDQNEGWSVATRVDLDQLCISAHAKSVQALKDFYDKRRGDPDHIVLMVRRVLETHYRRTFPAYFERQENLGMIVRSINAEGPTHPCFSYAVRLDSCNSSTCDHHHGDDALDMPKTGVDPDALAVIARDCLELINAVRP